jgi:hypothetical protein
VSGFEQFYEMFLWHRAWSALSAWSITHEAALNGVFDGYAVDSVRAASCDWGMLAEAGSREGR